MADRIRVGFTGSRRGLTDRQRRWLINFAAETPMAEFHHGDCVGADEQALWLLTEVGAGGVLHCHPPDRDEWWADTGRFAELGQVVHPRRPYLARNADIVRACDLLIACPAEMTAQPRGGTWWTVKFARESSVRSLVVRPEDIPPPSPDDRLGKRPI